MSHEWIAEAKFFELLDEEDARATMSAQAGGCRRCGGRLDRADYARKPRGGTVGAAGERLSRRRSLCCARRGCRARVTPPSLVFLGRRVYLGLTVLLASWRAGADENKPSPPARTRRRWLAWFREALPPTAWFAEQRARLSPPWEPGEVLPDGVLDRLLKGRSLAEASALMLRLLSPLSTASG